MSHSSARRGLTLVEVFVVIVVIGILLCLLFRRANIGREAPRRASCINTMKQLGLALHNYHDRVQVLPGLQFAAVAWRHRARPGIEQRGRQRGRVQLADDDPAVRRGEQPLPEAERG